jgi:hypothetical protein
MLGAMRGETSVYDPGRSIWPFSQAGKGLPAVVIPGLGPGTSLCVLTRDVKADSFEI